MLLLVLLARGWALGFADPAGTSGTGTRVPGDRKSCLAGGRVQPPCQVLRGPPAGPRELLYHASPLENRKKQIYLQRPRGVSLLPRARLSV